MIEDKKGLVLGESSTCGRRRFKFSVMKLSVGQETEMIQTFVKTVCST